MHAITKREVHAAQKKHSQQIAKVSYQIKMHFSLGISEGERNFSLLKRDAAEMKAMSEGHWPNLPKYDRTASTFVPLIK